MGSGVRSRRRGFGPRPHEAGQNVGYQSYMLIFPVTGQGMVVMTGSDSGTPLRRL
jgi:hypothetical protein